MKRFFSFILSFMMIFTFSACGNKNNDDNKISIDVEYYAKLGQIPECEYKIGDSVEKIENELETTQLESDHDHDTLQIVEGEKSVLIDNGSYCYYYLKEKKDKGISYIVSYNDAFGFEIGTLSFKIKEALKSFDFQEENINNENAFFMLSNTGNLLRYTFSDYTVLFIFENDALCATAFYLTKDWQ